MNRIALTEEIKGVQKAVDADLLSAMKTEETGLTALLETAKSAPSTYLRRSNTRGSFAPRTTRKVYSLVLESNQGERALLG